VFQGGIIYLVQLLFLLIGEFDPMRSTFAFVIASSFMIIPLWIGVDRLWGKKAALIVGSIYALFPPCITGTLELTNPYYQLALTPVLIWILSLYIKKRNGLLAFLAGLMMGVLLQFHYQFILVMGVVGAYILFLKPKVGLRDWILIAFGWGIGFAPMIIFELRNNFYNIRTILIYIEHWGEFRRQMGGGIPIQYFLSLMLVTITLLAGKLAKLPQYFLTGGLILLMGWALRDFIVTPKQGGILKDWQYHDELRVNQIIKAENLANYNIAMWYDTRSITQRYLLMRENRDFDFENYRHNQYLFVVYANDNWQSDGAYELNTFKPSKTIKQWKINDKYNLYLAERK